jgi:LysM repeat protein
VVKSGDTLWSITQHFYAGDPRRGVWDLEQRNDLGQSVLLTPGQRLVLPW